MIASQSIGDIKRHTKTDEGLTKWPASGQPQRTTLARTTVAYWRTKVQKVTCRGGFESPHYSARIGHQKRREGFPLNSPNKEACAVKASKIFNYLIEKGWDATLEKYKPHTIKDEPEESPLGKTVGELIQANLKYSSARVQSLQA